MQGDDKETVIQGPRPGGGDSADDDGQTQILPGGPADVSPREQADGDQTAIIDTGAAQAPAGRPGRPPAGDDAADITRVLDGSGPAPGAGDERQAATPVDRTEVHSPGLSVPVADTTEVFAGGGAADHAEASPPGLSVPVADSTEVLAGDSADAVTQVLPVAGADASTAVLTGDRTEVADVAQTAVIGDDETAVTAVGSIPAAGASAAGTRGPGLRTGTGGTTGLGGFRTSGKAANLAVGDVIDQRFVLDEELGRGGMSVVFRARDTIKEEAGDANPYVALKILRGDFSLHPDAWIALQQEISKTQSLSHPHIVTVHDFKIDRELGLPFAQMEEMRGESLEDLIKRHPDGLGDPKRIGEILMAVADGLGYAHSQGIVHADMKPSNVFITEEGDVKLLDFGIARFIPGKKKRGGREEVFGEGGLSALTPTYASPEMFAGESPLPADDIYALGVIAVELGSGEHPFSSVLGSPKPAVAAADAGLVPERFPGLKNSQWKAIASSLRADREQRPVDGYEFLAMYRPKSMWLRAVSALTVMLAIAVVVVWIRGEQKRPDIPFEELPLEQQVRIEQALESGEVALTMRDVNGALFYYAEAFELHPNNRRAIDGHESVVDVIADAPLPEDRDELRRRLQQANALLAYPALEDSRKLRGYLRDLEKLQIE